MDNKKQIEAITKKLDLIRRVLNCDPSNHYCHYDWVDIDKANSEYDSYQVKLHALRFADMSPQEQLAKALTVLSLTPLAQHSKTPQQVTST